jgi:hypothetical protein
MGHGYSTARLGEFGQALDFRCRVRLPTACIPDRIVPHSYGQVTLYCIMSGGVPYEEESVSNLDKFREKRGWLAMDGSLRAC